MSESIGIIITGASGRMGRMLIETVEANQATHLVGVTERAGHTWIGQDLGTAMGRGEMGVAVVDDLLEILPKAKAIIDFTSPEATVAHSVLAAQARVAHVIGTTGMDDAALSKLKAAARHATIVRAGNMSLGVNLLVQITKQVAAALDEDFDIEILEAHHSRKVDVPSGTAIMLGEAAAEGRRVSLANVRDAGRDGITGAREAGAIGFSAIRGGDIVGEHDVIFAAAGERLVLRHIATDRAIFARGALKAAIWAQDKGPGEFSMLDVLGL